MASNKIPPKFSFADLVKQLITTLSWRAKMRVDRDGVVVFETANALWKDRAQEFQIECTDREDYSELIIYMDSKFAVPVSALTEMAIAVNFANFNKNSVGRLCFDPLAKTPTPVTFVARMMVEDSTIGIETIYRMVQNGEYVFDEFGPMLESVALRNTSAAVAISEFWNNNRAKNFLPFVSQKRRKAPESDL